MYKFCKTEQSAQRQRELEKGLLAMMERHRFEEISVSDLCDRMGIPRKSFYRYFSSKDGALMALLDHTLMEFYEAGGIDGLRGGSPAADLERYFVFWEAHKNLIDAVIHSNLGGMLMERSVALAKREDLMPGYLQNWDDMLKDSAISFAICGLISMVYQWHIHGYQIPAQKMAKAAIQLLSRPLIPGF